MDNFFWQLSRLSGTCIPLHAHREIFFFLTSIVFCFFEVPDVVNFAWSLYGFPWSKIAIMHLVYISTFYITVVFDFSWNDCTTQEKLETMVMQFFLSGGWGRLTRWNMVYVEMVSYHLYYMHMYYYHIKCYYFNHYYCCYCSTFVYYRTGA